MGGANLDETTFPTRLPCFNDGNASCPVTDTMLQFLNITTKKEYLQVYCLNPPSDSCAFDYCPNPDISGPAIRVSTYVTNICLAMLILYSREKNGILAAFYSQLLTVYSFMLTATIAIQQGNLTRLHATFAQYSVSSPLSLYMLIYCIRSTFARQKNKHHRMVEVFGEGQWLNRTLVIAMFPFWITLTVFIALPSQRHRFAQYACDWRQGESGKLGFFYYNPFSIAQEVWKVVASLAPVFLLVIFWIMGTYLQRHVIWKKDRKRKYFPVARIWGKVNEHYPFVRFYTLILLPFSIWCLTLELGTRPADETIQVSFGQILPLFVAVPPLLGVIQLLPRIWPWFRSLTWVEWIRTRVFKRVPRPPLPHREVSDMSTISKLPMHSANSSEYGNSTTGRRPDPEAAPLSYFPPGKPTSQNGHTPQASEEIPLAQLQAGNSSPTQGHAYGGGDDSGYNRVDHQSV